MTGFQIPEQKALTEHEFQDRRRFCIVPIRAANDRKLSVGAWRTLVALCAYSSKGGIIWVSQKRIGDDIGISQPAVNRQVKRLKAWGYLERISHGVKGIKADTLRIVYAPELKTADAIAIAGENPIHLQTERHKTMGRPRKIVNNPNPVIRTGISQCGMDKVEMLQNGNEEQPTGHPTVHVSERSLAMDAPVSKHLLAMEALAAAYRAEGLPVPDRTRLLLEVTGAR